MKICSFLLLLYLGQPTEPLSSNSKPAYVSSGRIENFQQAGYPSGYAALHEFFHRHATYPELAGEYSIEGEVWVQFWVLSDGNIHGTTVMSGPGYGLEEEALRLVHLMGKWQPAREGGKAVPSRVHLLIRFSLY